jgi:hypothetical protein
MNHDEILLKSVERSKFQSPVPDVLLRAVSSDEKASVGNTEALFSFI